MSSTQTNVSVFVFAEVCTDGQGSKANLYCNGTAQLKIQVYYDLNNATFTSVGLCSRTTVTSTDEGPENYPLPTGYTVTQLGPDLEADFEACDGNTTFTPQNMEGKTLAEFVLVSTDPAVYDIEGKSTTKDIMAYVTVDGYVEKYGSSVMNNQTIYSDMSTETTVLSSGVEVCVKWQPKIEIHTTKIPSGDISVWQFYEGSIYDVSADFGTHTNYALNVKSSDHSVVSLNGGPAEEQPPYNKFYMSDGFQMPCFDAAADYWTQYIHGMVYHGELQNESFGVERADTYHYNYNFEKSNNSALLSFAAFYRYQSTNEKKGAICSDAYATKISNKIVVHVVDIYGRKSVAEFYMDISKNPMPPNNHATFISTCVDQKPQQT